MSPLLRQPITYGLDPSIARFSVAQYQRMIETDILTGNDKVELLEGYIVYKWPEDPPANGQLKRHQPITYGTDPSTMRFSAAQYQRMIEEGILRE